MGTSSVMYLWVTVSGDGDLGIGIRCVEHLVQIRHRRPIGLMEPLAYIGHLVTDGARRDHALLVQFDQPFSHLAVNHLSVEIPAFQTQISLQRGDAMKDIADVAQRYRQPAVLDSNATRWKREGTDNPLSNIPAFSANSDYFLDGVDMQLAPRDPGRVKFGGRFGDIDQITRAPESGLEIQGAKTSSRRKQYQKIIDHISREGL